MSAVSAAIVRPPAPTFHRGLTTAALGAPDLALAVRQHAAYCRALEDSGLRVIRLAPDPAHPDSPFVEDTVVLSGECAILTRPGAPARRGEIAAIEPEIATHYAKVARIEAPGTLDGGDVCDCDDHVLIGISARTNPAGAEQLARVFTDHGRAASLVDIRHSRRLLHLKSGVSYLGDGRVAVVAALGDHPELRRYEQVRVGEDEEYAANAVRVNDVVLVAAGYPRFARALGDLGYGVVPLDVSEFRKMDGGLSCLSLRF